MAHPLSGHLLNASALMMAAAVALAADRLSLGPAGTGRPVDGVDGLGDAAAFAGAGPQQAMLPRAEIRLLRDPFESSSGGNSVASPRNTSTVSLGTGSRELTAILVANNRPVAVIDDEVVGVGDVLRGGARVSRIQADRVFLVEKDGKWRTLTLAAERP